ncbi:hypothetical protein QEN19_002647 [Hanseniaspora menglaensis]
MSPSRLQGYLVNALEGQKICKFRIPKDTSNTEEKDIFNDGIINWLDTVVASDLKTIVAETVYKYEEDITKAYGKDFNDTVLPDIIESKLSQFKNLTQKIIHKEIDEVVLPVLKTSILHTNRASSIVKSVNFDSINPDLQSLKSTAIRKDMADYFKFYDQFHLLNSDANKNYMVADSITSDGIKDPMQPKIYEENNDLIETEIQSPLLTNREHIIDSSSSIDVEVSLTDAVLHESVAKYNIIF